MEIFEKKKNGERESKEERPEKEKWVNYTKDFLIFSWMMMIDIEFSIFWYIGWGTHAII